MAKNETVRIRPIALVADEDAFVALQEMRAYRPVNPAYTRETLTACHDAMRTAREAEVKAEQALAAARDNVVAAEWEFHNGMLGVKAQVVAQFGADSNEVQSLGIKKRSEYKSPKPHKQKTSA
jgi:hypothetical protein